jgi:hypothetical protein
MLITRQNISATYHAMYSAGPVKKYPGLFGCRQPVWGVSWGGGGGARPTGCRAVSVRYRNMCTTLLMPPCKHHKKEQHNIRGGGTDQMQIDGGGGGATSA